METFLLPVVEGRRNLSNYDETYKNFDWKEIEKEFSWYQTGKVNLAYEAIDRHCDTSRKNKVALYYSDAERDEKYTFFDLKRQSNKFGNALKSLGIQKGDRIFAFMPRTPELYITILGSIKVGAIVAPLYEEFMEGAVKERLEDSAAVAIITTPDLLKRIPVAELPDLKHVIVTGDISHLSERQVRYSVLMERSSDRLEIEWVDRDDGLILHYTSGCSGKPQGVLHVHNAMLQHYVTAKWVLDLQEEDIYWCTADPGWVTGTSYGIFAPWLSGASNLICGSRFCPQDSYSVIEKYGVTVWYSAPTTYRMLMSAEDEFRLQYDLSSLRHVLSFGEHLNPEVVHWGMRVFGKRIHDTWWMTETGAQMICNYPCMEIKPGSMGKPIPGIVAAIIDDKGNELPPYQLGNIAIKTGWPSMIREIWGNQSQYRGYFQPPGWFVSGDSAYIDDDGYFWFQRRGDDCIKTSGERVGPFEVESKLIEHPAVAEAGVIGKPDPLRGETIKAFISLREGYVATDELLEQICNFVKISLSAHAAPREIEIREQLPKTRSGKIMRRVLKAWELNLPTSDLPMTRY